jgi:lipopolysaccharide/colanic/teichoic acid biosynthesis glycosyltransferase
MKMARHAYTARGKRILDLLFTLPGLLLLLPVLFAIAAVVRCSLGRPVFFTQKRPGKDGVPFLLYKFRTMRNDTDGNGALLSDEKRLTRLGKFLRSSSFDELPELWNVLRGEMSLVGPRPLLIQYLDRYTPEQARRHEVKPGLTGWAQVNGRNAITWEDRFKFDVWYVDHCSLGLDLKIIAMTVRIIVKREGINQPGQATMTEFKGLGKDVR